MTTPAELQGLALYGRAEQLLAADASAEALPLLEQACRLLPGHGAAHHLLGKAYARAGRLDEAERCQRLSLQLDASIGWNAFALAELLEQRLLWSEAALVYGRALEALPQEAWISAKAEACRQQGILGGEDLRQGLGPQAYRFWIEQLEPPLPPALVPLHQNWHVLPATETGTGALPVQGWLVLLGPGAVLRPRGLQAIEAWLADQPGGSLQPDLISVDEDGLTSEGIRHAPWFKPGLLAESSWSTPWLESFTAWRLSWLRLQELPWPPIDPLERQAWIWRALAFRPVHGHLAQVLVHVRLDEALAGAPSRSDQAQLLHTHLRALGEQVERVLPHPQQRTGFALEWALPAGLRCTVIVPTRNRAELLAQCLLSVEASTAGAGVSLDWVVVDNGSSQPNLAALLEARRQCWGERFRVIRDDRPFNWSVMNNRAAAISDADLLLFLNNDVEAHERGWLEAMAAQAQRPSIGCVGALLQYPDGRLQHAGVVVGLRSGADHAYRHLSPDHQVHRGRSCYLSDWGAVTGACLMVRRSLFERAGGFDPSLPVEFNDIEFCLRLGQCGYRHVVDPRAVLIHHECQSRDPEASLTAADAQIIMQRRWGSRMQHTGPWWPQACSCRWTDGRPVQFDPL